MDPFTVTKTTSLSYTVITPRLDCPISHYFYVSVGPTNDKFIILDNNTGRYVSNFTEDAHVDALIKNEIYDNVGNSHITFS